MDNSLFKKHLKLFNERDENKTKIIKVNNEIENIDPRFLYTIKMVKLDLIKSRITAQQLERRHWQ